MDQTHSSHAPRIGSAACSAAITVAIALAGLAHAGDWVEPETAGIPPVAVWPAAPWIQLTMEAGIRSKLAAAIALAAARVEESPECAGLFAELGADGAAILARSLYFSAPHYQIGHPCRRATAFVYFGQEPTFLCSGFASLADERAALVLIHEALHHAGLAESPSAPGAMSAAAIEEMVRKACGSQKAVQSGPAR